MIEKRSLPTGKEFHELGKKLNSDDAKKAMLEIDDDLSFVANLGIALIVIMKGAEASFEAIEMKSMPIFDAAWGMTSASMDMIKSTGLDNLPISTVLYGHLAECRFRDISKKIKTSERDYHDELCTSFDKYLPELTFIDREVQIDIDDRDRLDILAESKDGRPVIIELKLGNKSAHKQLRSYAVGFENPILINISEELPPNRRSDINYMTFKGIGIDFDENNSDQLISEGVV